MLVTLLVTAIILPIVFSLIADLMSQTQSETRSTAAMAQEENAGQWLLQYLHGAVRVLPGSTATTLDVEIENGTDQQTGADLGATEYATLTAALVAGAKGTGTFTITVTPSSGTAIRETSTYAENVSDPFTYYYSSGAVNNAPSSSDFADVVGIGVDLPFSDAIGDGESVARTDVATLDTTVYLENSENAPGTTVTFSPNTSLSGMVVTVPVTVSVGQTGSTANLDDGTVTYVVQDGGVTVPTTCSSEPVSSGSGSGTASCSFTAPGGGTYTVQATFNGSASAAESSPASEPVVVP